jgi:hypothetical protein
MKKYKVVYSYPSEPIKQYSYIEVFANSEGEAKGKARKELSEIDKRYANIYAAQKQ